MTTGSDSRQLLLQLIVDEGSALSTLQDFNTLGQQAAQTITTLSQPPQLDLSGLQSQIDQLSSQFGDLNAAAELSAESVLNFGSANDDATSQLGDLGSASDDASSQLNDLNSTESSGAAAAGQHAAASRDAGAGLGELGSQAASTLAEMLGLTGIFEQGTSIFSAFGGSASDAATGEATVGEGAVEAGVAVAGLTVGVAAVGAALVAAKSGFDTFLEGEGSMQQLDAEFGLTTQSAAAMQFQFERVGMSGTQLETIATRMQAGLAQAETQIDAGKAPTGRFVDGLNAMGIALTNSDGSIKTTAELLPDIFAKFEQAAQSGGKFSNGMTVATAATDLFGSRGGAAAIPALEGINGGLDTAYEKTGAYSGAIDANMQAYHNWTESSAELHDALDTLGVEIGGAVVPALTALEGGAAKALEIGQKLSPVWQTLGSGFQVVGEQIHGALAVAGMAIDALEVNVGMLIEGFGHIPGMSSDVEKFGEQLVSSGHAGEQAGGLIVQALDGAKSSSDATAPSIDKLSDSVTNSGTAAANSKIEWVSWGNGVKIAIDQVADASSGAKDVNGLLAGSFVSIGDAVKGVDAANKTAAQGQQQLDAITAKAAQDQQKASTDIASGKSIEAAAYTNAASLEQQASETTDAAVRKSLESQAAAAIQLGTTQQSQADKATSAYQQESDAAAQAAAQIQGKLDTLTNTYQSDTDKMAKAFDPVVQHTLQDWQQIQVTSETGAQQQLATIQSLDGQIATLEQQLTGVMSAEDRKRLTDAVTSLQTQLSEAQHTFDGEVTAGQQATQGIQQAYKDMDTAARNSVADQRSALTDLFSYAKDSALQIPASFSAGWSQAEATVQGVYGQLTALDQSYSAGVSGLSQQQYQDQRQNLQNELSDAKQTYSAEAQAGKDMATAISDARKADYDTSVQLLQMQEADRQESAATQEEITIDSLNLQEQLNVDSRKKDANQLNQVLEAEKNAVAYYDSLKEEADEGYAQVQIQIATAKNYIMQDQANKETALANLEASLAEAVANAQVDSSQKAMTANVTSAGATAGAWQSAYGQVGSSATTAGNAQVQAAIDTYNRLVGPIDQNIALNNQAIASLTLEGEAWKQVGTDADNGLALANQAAKDAIAQIEALTSATNSASAAVQNLANSYVELAHAESSLPGGGSSSGGSSGGGGGSSSGGGGSGGGGGGLNPAYNELSLLAGASLQEEFSLALGGNQDAIASLLQLQSAAPGQFTYLPGTGEASIVDYIRSGQWQQSMTASGATIASLISGASGGATIDGLESALIGAQLSGQTGSVASLEARLEALGVTMAQILTFLQSNGLTVNVGNAPALATAISSGATQQQILRPV